MKKFRVGALNRNPIEEVVVSRESKKFVWFRWLDREYRVTKNGSDKSYFDTWREARDFLYQEALGRFDNAKSQVHAAEKQLDAIIAMREPKTEGES